MTISSPRKRADASTSERASVRLWLRLFACSTTIEKRLRRHLSERFGTTLPRFDALSALDRSASGMTMSALSEALLVSNGNVTLLVQALKAEGHVAITRSRADRRATIVKMTPEGKAHFAMIAAAHHAWIEEILADVDPDDRDELSRLLGVLKRRIGGPKDDRA